MVTAWSAGLRIRGSRARTALCQVINPLLAALAHSQPPMPAWLYWVTVGGAGQQVGKPSILYDAVGRLVDRTLSLDQVTLTLTLAPTLTLARIPSTITLTTLWLDQAVAEVAAQGAAGRLCFEFATIGLEGRAGQWDAMMCDGHPGPNPNPSPVPKP
jgi:hypothetical protein